MSKLLEDVTNHQFDQSHVALLINSQCQNEYKCKLEIKSPYTLLKLSYLEIRDAEIKNF